MRPIDEGSQLTVKAVKVVHHPYDLEFWQGEPAWWGPDIHREAPGALSMARIATIQAGYQLFTGDGRSIGYRACRRVRTIPRDELT